MENAELFEQAQLHQVPSGSFVVDVEGFEGPIDVLLSLARDQKVDLTQISILELADQYLAFVAQARRRDLELAADYLVMAAWLAYLKSRLLLPELESGDEPSGAEMAAALAFHLRRLEAMQEVGARLVARARLGRDFFPLGAVVSPALDDKTVFQVTLFDLLKAYGGLKRRGGDRSLHIEPWELYTVEDSLLRLRRLLGGTADWASLSKFLPQGLKDDLARRSALASTFAASLELAKEGKVKLRQTGTFGTIYLRPATPRRQGRPPSPEPAPDE